MASKPAGPKKRKRQYIDPRLAAAISHSLRVEILIECSRAPISPVEFFRRHGGTLTTVAYHFRRLKELDCLTVVDEVPRRGAHEHIYALTRRALLTDDDFAMLPPNIRGGFEAMIFAPFAERVEEAFQAQTLDRQPNHHLTWSPLRLDKEGFDRIMEKLGDVFEYLSVEQVAANERLARSGEQPIHTTLAMFGFESPAPDRDHTLNNDNV